MKLYNEDITRDMDIEDETGKKLNAKLAGISSDQLIIALEPEAAAICCRFEPVKQKGNYDSLSKFKTGCKVMVVDAGENGSMKNIYKACSGDLGATKVDDEYLEFLKAMLGNEVVEEFKRNNTEDYKYMMHEFELKRRAVDLSISDQQIIFRIPSALLVKCIRGKNIQEASIQRNTIKVNVSEVAILLKTQVDGIVDHVSNLIDQSTIDEGVQDEIIQQGNKLQ
ncbi:HS12A-like protein [Mya arenaria]|uniref:HS12A-like protein n=1 Tax=Mya arenaria TaxID=6604 RepID=A0ABY7G019_MYAAR|nr:HS12A-like protein [Mya arenaria]